MATKRKTAKRQSPEQHEADARGLSEYLNVRVHPWLMQELDRLAHLEGRSKGNLARHALEIGLRFFQDRHGKAK